MGNCVVSLQYIVPSMVSLSLLLKYWWLLKAGSEPAVSSHFSPLLGNHCGISKQEFKPYFIIRSVGKRSKCVVPKGSAGLCYLSAGPHKSYSRPWHISVSLILMQSQWKCCVLDKSVKIKMTIELWNKAVGQVLRKQSSFTPFVAVTNFNHFTCTWN